LNAAGKRQGPDRACLRKQKGGAELSIKRKRTGFTIRDLNANAKPTKKVSQIMQTAGSDTKGWGRKGEVVYFQAMGGFPFGEARKKGGREEKDVCRRQRIKGVAREGWGTPKAGDLIH